LTAISVCVAVRHTYCSLIEHDIGPGNR
jgi:hypothetical protein